MTTAFQTGPGFYAAVTSKTDPSIPPNVVRIYCARLEAYDLAAGSAEGDDIIFNLLVAKAENNPPLARALLQLHKSLGGNLEVLNEMAR